MPKVSEVGIVVVNQDNAAHVRAAIESAARQTVRRLRIVVVDDASVDGSDVVIRKCLSDLADERIRYVRLPAPLGQAGALRRGLAELNTTFVAFLASDDAWYESFVAQHLVAHLNADFPVALTTCESQAVPSNGRRPANALDPRSKPRLKFCEAWTRNWSSNGLSSLMFRRDFVNLVLAPPNRDLRRFADVYLANFACLLTGVITVRETLYASRAQVPDKPSRDAVLRLVADVLHSHAQPLRSAFGDYSHGRAQALMARALGPPRARAMQAGRGRLDAVVPARLIQWFLTLRESRS